MLKKSVSVVLGSSKSSTYPRGYVSGFDSPAALLNSLFEHPAKMFSCCSRHDNHRNSRMPTSLLYYLLDAFPHHRFGLVDSGTVNTGQPAVRTTFSAVLPKKILSTFPELPP